MATGIAIKIGYMDFGSANPGQRRRSVDLSRCAWDTLKVFLKKAVNKKEPTLGAVMAIQTFGDFLINRDESSICPFP